MKTFYAGVIAYLKSSNTLSVAKGAEIAGAGVALSYMVNHLGYLQLGENTALIAAFLSVALNAARKAIYTQPTKEETPSV